MTEPWVDDAGNRKALYARLLFAFQDTQDPWSEMAAAPARKEFEVISAQ